MDTPADVPPEKPRRRRSARREQGPPVSAPDGTPSGSGTSSAVPPGSGPARTGSAESGSAGRAARDDESGVPTNRAAKRRSRHRERDRERDQAAGGSAGAAQAEPATDLRGGFRRHDPTAPERTAPERTAPERPAHDRPGHDRPGHDRPGPRSAAADRPDRTASAETDAAPARRAFGRDGSPPEVRRGPRTPERGPDQGAPAERPKDPVRSPRDRRAELAERALRNLVSTRGTQLSWSNALRARDYAAPTAQDLADAAEDVVIVQRHYTPAEPLPNARRGKEDQPRGRFSNKRGN